MRFSFLCRYQGFIHCRPKICTSILHPLHEAKHGVGLRYLLVVAHDLRVVGEENNRVPVGRLELFKLIYPVLYIRVDTLVENITNCIFQFVVFVPLLVL